MLRSITTVLLFVMLYVQTPVRQILKVYDLVEHYFEHKALDERMGFFSYLMMHYGSDQQYPDHERDAQLPFKHYNHTSLTFTFFSNPPLVVEAQKYHGASETAVSLYRSPYHARESLCRIWQPPRA